MVTWCVGPPLSRSRGMESAVYVLGAGCHVCGVPRSVSRGTRSVLWRPCGARGR